MKTALITIVGLLMVAGCSNPKQPAFNPKGPFEGTYMITEHTIVQLKPVYSLLAPSRLSLGPKLSPFETPKPPQACPKHPSSNQLMSS